MDNAIRIDLGGAAQAGIVLARRGTTLPTDKDYARMPLCYHIAFHSIGSRLFKLRQQDGLFYSATGVLGCDATRTHPGMDFVCTAVDPSVVNVTVEKLQGLLAQLRSTPAVTQAELCAAQRWYEQLTVDRLQQPDALCDTVMLYRRLYPDTPYDAVIRDHLQQVQSATVDDVNALMQRVFAAPFEHVVVSN